MKFEIQEKSRPQNGDERGILKFAWLPVKVEQPYTGRQFILWLDKYHEKQRYSVGGSYGDHWSEWVTVQRWIA